MKILIFGASGATGHNLVSQALAHEHLVRAFVRTPSKLRQQHENIEIFQGDVADYDSVANAIRNQDAVLSALGASGPFRRDFTLIRGIQNIVSAMEALKVKRLIYQSFLGVKENRKELGFMIDKILPLILRNIIVDHEAKEDIIVKSSLDWTIVRCPMLTHGPFSDNYIDGDQIKSASILPSISRADVADFMLKQINEKKYLHKKPRIMLRA